MKECIHCGGPNAPENRVCDYCGMAFDAETIPEGSIDPREQAKLDEEAWMEGMREKQLVELNLDKTTDQNVTINTPGGQKIVINDPIEKAAAVAGTVLSGSAGMAAKAIGQGLSNLPGLQDDPRFGPGPSRPASRAPAKRPGKRKSGFGCLGCGIIAAVGLVMAAVMMFVIIF